MRRLENSACGKRHHLIFLHSAPTTSNKGWIENDTIDTHALLLHIFTVVSIVETEGGQGGVFLIISLIKYTTCLLHA